MNFARISNKKLTVALHVLAWSILVFIPRYIIHTYGSGDTHFLYQFYANTVIYGSIFYLNYLWLVPKLFYRENKLMYILIAAGVIVVFYFIMWYINDHLFADPAHDKELTKFMEDLSKNNDHIKPPIKQFRIYNYFYTSVLVTGFSLGLGVMQKLGQNEKQRKELEKEKLNSELAFLKNQISPHFFFNTLNNIYSLIGIDQDEAQESVHKLSKLMRYLIYESEHGETKLSDEISFLNHYIDLMKLRLSSKVELSVSLPENESGISIPPLLFIPFIENAFKHGISYRETSFIDIKMAVEGTSISFVVRNSTPQNDPQDDLQHSGIGLENVKKRLNLLFPNSHQLKIEQKRNEFMVELQLDAKSPK